MKTQIQNNQQIQQNNSNQNLLNINQIQLSQSQFIGSCINQFQIDQSQKNNQIYKSQNSQDQIHNQKPNSLIDNNIQDNNINHDRQKLRFQNSDNQESPQQRKSKSYHQKSASQKNFQNNYGQQQQNLNKNEQKMTKQHIQIAYKFYENYYKQKLMPFYKTFNIDPYIKDFSKTKQFKNNKNQNDLTSEDIQKLKQFQQIKKQLDSRMIPVITGIRCSIGSIIQKKSLILTNMSFLIKQNISQTINQRLCQIQILALNAYNKMMILGIIPKNIQQKNQDFMQHGLIRCIHEFLKFVSSNLNPNVMFIIQSVFIIFLDIIIDFYEKNDSSDILRVHDINQFYQKINVMIQKIQHYKFYFIDEEDLIQLLGWFSSWTMVKQYMLNMFNLDSLADITKNMDQINLYYQQNVKKYVQYKETIEKQSQINKKSSKENKIIKKRMLQELRKQKNIEFFEQQGYNIKQLLKFNIKPPIQKSFKINKQNLQNNKLNIINNKNFDYKSDSNNQSAFYSIISNDQKIDIFLEKVKQQTQDWNKRFEQVFSIIKNPISFKQNYKQKVQIQRNEVQQLLFLNKKSISDPFLIKKNYRKQGNLYSSSNQFLQSYEYQGSGNENYAQNQSNYNQKNQQSQEMFE